MAAISRAAKESFAQLSEQEKAVLQEEAARKTRVLEGKEVPQNSEEASWARITLLQQASQTFATLGTERRFYDGFH